ncbi:acyltransferase [Microbacterium sp. Kw_RZR3]|uniref:acyltransferase family protein n=1 Tax=Microbacterium sp. Kw_RZR3 TaxID=3032903 RepID=UPI0023D9FF2E|nr:acyltransferase [Microbacterium sp. Kw_RZR3]MDF2045935.1 acyltransferase [Microbacterium sp. Kw_RZR3]
MNIEPRSATGSARTKPLRLPLALYVGESISSLWEAGKNPRNMALDGLRGIAILLVVASHVSSARLPAGGMVGVTLFFTLSGYLITGLLIREKSDTGRVSFGDFYIRRALRLLPAILFLLVLTPFVLWALRDPALGPDLIPASLITLFYMSNVFRAMGDHLVVYGHTWSLSVEEQFYILWPAIFVLVILRRIPRPAQFWSLFALAVLFAAWRIISAYTMPFDRAYFSLDTNAFGLLAGAALAIRPPKIPKKVASWMAALAVLTLVVISVYPLEGGSPQYYSFLVAAAPLAAAVGLVAITGARHASIPLGTPPLVFFGRLSYGLYLWHEVILFTRPDGSPITETARVVAAVVSILIATVSWVLVERPALLLKKRFERVKPETALSDIR